MKLFSGWLGMALFTIGLCSMIFHSELPEDSQISTVSSLILVFLGAGLMYYGRKHLPAWLGLSFGGDDSTD